MWETWVQSLGQEDSLEKEMATHSRTLAWRIPWTEEHSRLLQPMGSQRVGHDWATSLSLNSLSFKCCFFVFVFSPFLTFNVIIDVVELWCFKLFFSFVLLFCFLLDWNFKNIRLYICIGAFISLFLSCCSRRYIQIFHFTVYLELIFSHSKWNTETL